MLGLAAIMMLLLLLLLLLSALSGGENSLKDFKNPLPSSLLSLATTEFCFFPVAKRRRPSWNFMLRTMLEEGGNESPHSLAGSEWEAAANMAPCTYKK